MFLLATLLAVVADTSLMGALAIGGVVPAVSPIVAAFVAVSAPPLVAMWACLLLGLVLDLCTAHMLGPDRPFHLIGPSALGYLFAANLVLPLRTMVFRRNPLTLAVLAGLVVVAAGLVSTLVWSVRSLYADAPIVFAGRSAVAELVLVGFRAAYTAALAVPIGWLLVRTAGLWGFAAAGQRFGRW